MTQTIWFILSYKGKFNIFSTPNRLVVHIDKIIKQISKKSEEIRGPNTASPDKALEGFLRSNNINKSQVFVKKTEKGDFYFYKNQAHSYLEDQETIEQSLNLSNLF